MTPKEAALRAMEESVRAPVDRHRARSVGRVCSDCFHSRNNGTPLPAIRRDDRDLGDLVGLQRPHAQPRARRASAETEGESHGLLRRFFNWFNRVFGRATDRYIAWSGVLIRKSAVALAMLVIFGLAAGFFSSRLPTSFLPDEDQGYFYVNLQLPMHLHCNAPKKYATKVEKIIENTPGVKYATSVIGISLLSLVRTSYNAFIFVNVDEWKDRKSRAKQFQVMKQHINQELEDRIPEGIALSDFSRHPLFREWALPADSRLYWRIAPGRMCSSFRRT